MQRFLSFKTLSNPSQHLPISPFRHFNLIQPSISLASKKPNQLTTLSPFLRSRSISDSFRQWRPLIPTCSRQFSAVLKQPILANYKTSITHLPSVRCASFFRRVIQDMGERFRRRGSELGRPFQVHRNYWRFRIPTAEGVVFGLISANVAVFMLWKTMDPLFMMKNFMISWDNFVSGRIHTLITSAFSQKDSWHLFSNMIGLYFFGTSIGEQFGSKFLLKLYLAGAIGGSVFYLVHKAISSSEDAKYTRGLMKSREPFSGCKWCCKCNCATQHFSLSKGCILCQFLHTCSSNDIGSSIHWKRYTGYDEAASQEKLTWGVLWLLLSHGLGLEKDGSNPSDLVFPLSLPDFLVALQRHLRRSSLGGCCGCCSRMG